MRSEGLCQRKIPMTLAGIKPATFRFVAQHLNHCATAVPNMYLNHALFSKFSVLYPRISSKHLSYFDVSIFVMHLPEEGHIFVGLLLLIQLLTAKMYGHGLF